MSAGESRLRNNGRRVWNRVSIYLTYAMFIIANFLLHPIEKLEFSTGMVYIEPKGLRNSRSLSFRFFNLGWGKESEAKSNYKHATTVLILWILGRFRN
jgi:hypothetical protein